MFTGLVQATGVIADLLPTPAGARLRVRPHAWAHVPTIGDSIAVSGCCLTVAGRASPDGTLDFDVIHESLRRTILGDLRVGSPVNLEHAATPSTLLGGHVVQGHIDAVGVFERVEPGQDWRIRVRPPADFMPFITPKGSVTIDGVSLTIAAAEPASASAPDQGWFEVALIPTTLERTTLGKAAAGQRCNLESDIMARTIVHWLRHYSQGPGSGSISGSAPGSSPPGAA